MKLDILAIAAHPDDAELSCGGTLAAAVAEGKKVGILDLTRGELGSRGSADLRQKEAVAAAQILGLSMRQNAGFSDGFFKNNNRHKLAIIQYLRRYQPTIVLANAPSDRHPDHGRAAQLVREACFLSGLAKIETRFEGEIQTAFRPKQLFHYIQSDYLTPDFILDISHTWATKMEAIKAFSSQFHNPDYQGDGSDNQTFISSPRFLYFLEARARELGQAIEADYGEGFIKSKALGVKTLSAFW
ncbi:bacillithiol biosynthesis deacetylase BshB1 [Hugenholtzia roseola]|uniref:bacillithiol biosynthesis deacetylase BshB1 n=1 Tax=Hugenholtzia roseola TaxID=1002 RepID=UPI0003F7CD55|nr:bacillithiol biosynthesis deacetylase BshB1 [Hugenholtzia roseola]